MLEYLPTVVPLEDAEVSAVLEKSFNRRGIRVVTRARFDPASVVSDESGVRVTVGRDGEEGTEEHAAEVMLVATGRAANVEDADRLTPINRRNRRGFREILEKAATSVPRPNSAGIDQRNAPQVGFPSIRSCPVFGVCL